MCIYPKYIGIQGAVQNHGQSVSLKPETSDQPDRETCALKCHYL